VSQAASEAQGAMKLLAPTSFQADFLSALQGLSVGSLYGSLPQDPSFRAHKALPQTTAKDLAAHIRQAREKGIGFVYAMNSRSTGSWEFTAEGQRWLIERLGWLASVGARGVVTANTYLMELMRKRFPQLDVHVSTLANVDDVDKALFYEDLGVGAIYVPEYTNRNFPFLRAVAQRVRCPIVLTVNLGCLMRCPFRDYHTSCISESRASLDNGHFVDYSMMKCTYMKVQSPVEVLKGAWVRPEDLHFYEEMGIKEFKIAGREQSTEWVLRAVRAYSSRTYNGYLNDIINGFDLVQPFGTMTVRVDNCKLDGFLPFMLKHDCHLGCLACTYCNQWAAKTVEASEEARVKQAQQIERTIGRFTSGSFRAPSVPKTTTGVPSP